jgi:hypothetical protein
MSNSNGSWLPVYCGFLFCKFSILYTCVTVTVCIRKDCHAVWNKDLMGAPIYYFRNEISVDVGVWFWVQSALFWFMFHFIKWLHCSAVLLFHFSYLFVVVIWIMILFMNTESRWWTESIGPESDPCKVSSWAALLFSCLSILSSNTSELCVQDFSKRVLQF